jgi:putative ABC transport system permease protein
LIQQNKKLYLKNLNMFVSRQLSSKMNTTFVSISLVCLMLFVSICTLSSGIGLSSNVASVMKKNAPFDASFIVRGALDENKASSAMPKKYDLVKKAKEVGLDDFAKDYFTVRYYKSDLTIPVTVVENNAEEKIDMNSYFLKLSDYNEVLKREGIAPITLASGEYAVNSEITNMAFRAAIMNYMKDPEPIKLGKAKLRTNEQKLFNNQMEVARNQDYNLTFIVPDKLTKGLPVVQDVLHINYPEQTAKYENLCKEGLSKLRFDKGVESNTQTRVDVMELSNSATTIIVYLGVYLGLIFLIAAAVMLAIGQLSETSDNISRYGLLRKIGADEKMMNKALFSQILIYFAAPMFLAIIHSSVGIPVVGQIVSSLGSGSILRGSLFTACALILIYGGYFWSTYQGGKRILNRDYRSVD